MRRMRLTALLAAGAVAAGGVAVGALQLGAATASAPGRSVAHLRPVPRPLTARVQVPAAGSPGSAPIEVHYSSPVVASAISPTVTPSVPGGWQVTGGTWTFTPTSSFPPATTVVVTVPAGVRSVNGTSLAAAVSAQYVTGAGSVVRLQQLLAGLGYLPVSFQAASPSPTSLAAAELADFTAAPGTFSWRWPGSMPGLVSHWLAGALGPMTRGATMAFQRVDGLPVTGVADAATWVALDQASLAGHLNPSGYSWVDISESLPETLTLWHDGQVVLSALTNTGIPKLATPVGSFDVYLRYRSQVMRGTNPNGTHYADLVHWASYFYRSDAIHEFIRASYGFPQSLGCAELPLSTAQAVWPYTPIGTLVTVQP